jgi:glycosyltransferase involved in cell wall biosynthesis
MFPFIIFNRRNRKICTLHGPPELAIKERKHRTVWRLYRVLEKLSLNRIDRYIAVNRGTMDYYSEKEPRLSGRISVIPVGIDINLFRPMDKGLMRERYGFEKDEGIILFIGRFSQEKGLDLLLEAFADLKGTVPSSRLVLLGSGPEKAKLEQSITRGGIKDVVFMEPVPHDKIPELINCADVFVLCSMYEGMPTVVLEALACGVPVVATDVGDVCLVVKNGETGYLVKERGSSLIAEGLMEVMDRGRDSYSSRCVEAAGTYSWDNVTEKILNMYRKLEGDGYETG